MRHAKRTDSNHADIRDGLRDAGWTVHDLSGAGGGVPDFMVPISPGIPHFLEVKDGDKPLSAQKLTKAQEKWHAYAWRITTKVRSLDEAITALTWAKGNA